MIDGPDTRSSEQLLTLMPSPGQLHSRHAFGPGLRQFVIFLGKALTLNDRFL
jgi:hypothetical protein